MIRVRSGSFDGVYTCGGGIACIDAGIKGEKVLGMKVMPTLMIARVCLLEMLFTSWVQ